ncbi:hypothetical protein [Salinicoccus carnicancri]|uniref:hypothetical protein n=1 Tax=Salinicoccus carnicancri TaxID=558170 RepID=UPI0002D492B2|nr:hypothetical protein [Salinicoccus carnicancri]
MNINLKEYPVINSLIEDEGCRITYEESGSLKGDFKISYRLESSRGRRISDASSIVSKEKALNSLEQRVRKKMNEEYDDARPFDNLRKDIRRINLLHETKRGSHPQVGGYSDPMTSWGINEVTDVEETDVEINLGGAGNVIIKFDALKDGSGVLVSSQGISGFFLKNSIGLVLEAIASYLYVDKEIRKAEMQKKMEQSRTYQRQFKNALKKAKGE